MFSWSPPPRWKEQWNCCCSCWLHFVGSENQLQRWPLWLVPFFSRYQPYYLELLNCAVEQITTSSSLLAGWLIQRGQNRRLGSLPQHKDYQRLTPFDPGAAWMNHVTRGQSVLPYIDRSVGCASRFLTLSITKVPLTVWASLHTKQIVGTERVKRKG